MGNNSCKKRALAHAIETMGMAFILWVISSTSAIADFDTSEFASKRSLKLEPISGETLVVAPIDTEIYNSVRPNLPDIRVLGDTTTEVPFLIEKAIETRTRITEKMAPASVDSLRELPGNRIEMTVTLEEDAPNADLLRIRTPLNNYERQVTVFGSSGGEDWEQLVDGALIFDYSRFFDIENQDVRFPENEHRHFRIIIEGIVDEKASPFRRLWLRSVGDQEVEHTESFSVHNRPFRIDHIELWAQREREAFKSERKTEYAMVGFTVTRDEEKKQTIVEIESGRDPLTSITLRSGNRNFSRRASLEVRKQVFAATEWVEIASGTLTSIEYLEYKKESLTIPFPEHRVSLYRLIIEDEDNAPLAIDSVTGEGRIYQIVFLSAPGSNYELVYDSEKAESPKYDIATVLAPIRHNYEPAIAVFGPEIANPAYDVLVVKPRSNLLENKVFLSAAIAAMVIILAWALYSTSRKIGA